ncbi:SsrA-binding protein SmpB, partial [Candidatus Microgenomates bacterium]|nr:SsrA-binding protein SmpB [Candidatus Microgenomates bacterium]
NRRVYHDYHILEELEVGIELTGPEVKSVKKGRMNLEGSFVKIKDSQAFLFNAHVPPYEFADQRDYEPARTRKLLLHKKEAISLQTKMSRKRLTLVPLSCYTKTGWIKIKIGLVKGKKEYEKRSKIKERDLVREQERILKSE